VGRKGGDLTSAMKALVEQGPAHAPELTPASIAKARRLKEATGVAYPSLTLLRLISRVLKGLRSEQPPPF
jgi:hypothetical protein